MELPSSSTATSAPSDGSLLNFNIVSEEIACVVLFQFLINLQKKGMFSFGESAKINECINSITEASMGVKPTHKGPDENGNISLLDVPVTGADSAMFVVVKFIEKFVKANIFNPAEVSKLRECVFKIAKATDDRKKAAAFVDVPINVNVSESVVKDVTIDVAVDDTVDEYVPVEDVVSKSMVEDAPINTICMCQIRQFQGQNIHDDPNCHFDKPQYENDSDVSDTQVEDVPVVSESDASRPSTPQSCHYCRDQAKDNHDDDHCPFN